jgi:antitoxin VapB
LDGGTGERKLKQVACEVVIVPDGPRRIIVPAEMAWDDFFDAPGIDLGAREQPAMQEREHF